MKDIKNEIVIIIKSIIALSVQFERDEYCIEYQNQKLNDLIKENFKSWNSIKDDGLPKERDSYLVWYEDIAFTDLGFYQVVNFYEGAFDVQKNATATHWMKLPKQPKKED